MEPPSQIILPYIEQLANIVYHEASHLLVNCTFLTNKRIILSYPILLPGFLPSCLRDGRRCSSDDWAEEGRCFAATAPRWGCRTHSAHTQDALYHSPRGSAPSLPTSLTSPQWYSSVVEFIHRAGRLNISSLAGLYGFARDSCSIIISISAFYF